MSYAKNFLQFEKRSELSGPFPAFALCVLLLLIVGSAVIVWYVPQAMQRAALESALKGNLDIINQVKLMRGYYTEQVVSRALATKTLTPSMQHAGKPDEIPLPATLVKDLSDLMAKHETTLSLTSPYPWPHRTERKMDSFESAAWAMFQRNPDQIVSEQNVVDGRTVLRVAVSDRLTSEACVSCHNSEPQSTKRDWKVGDVRAVFQVTRVIDDELAGVQKGSRIIVFGVLAGASVGSCAILILLAIFARRTRDRRVADHNAYYLAEHDVLTGLKNRSKLREVLDRTFAGNEKQDYSALLMIDLDGFKPVNDTHGHATGDQLLVAVAERLKSWAGPNDIVARMGGDEFAIIKAPPFSVQNLPAEIGALCKLFELPFEIDGNNLQIGASIGVAFLHQDAQNTSDLFIATDLALYTAKSEGKGRWRHFCPEMTATALRRMQYEADIKTALTENQLHLHYQPIRNAETGEVVKLEALLRWQHPRRGSVPPSEFIPVAEETGLIEAIGGWVLRRACHEVAAYSDNVRVAVNLSTRQLTSEKVVETLAAALKESQLAPHRLEVEITESVMLKNDQRTLHLLNEIRRLGVDISIDDFGTGYSCLSYLQTYPITGLKIDRSFVDSLGRTGSATAIVGAIISLAAALKLKTVAEGVETAMQVQELRQLGCMAFQGYYFDRPKPIGQIDMHPADADAKKAS